MALTEINAFPDRLRHNLGSAKIIA